MMPFSVLRPWLLGIVSWIVLGVGIYCGWLAVEEYRRQSRPVVIQTDDGRKMLYAHNNSNFVRVGDRVRPGEAIAEVGSTGRATGSHVHFEVKFQ